MPDTLRLVLLNIALAVLVTACADLQRGLDRDCACPTATKPVSPRETASIGKQRLMLNEGYSMLYTDASHLDLAGFILYVKVESEAVDALMTSITDFGEQLKQQLEHIAKDYPAVRIDLSPLPEMETRKRSAIGTDRALYFAPGIGRSGREYERTMLIGFANGINHERHLCQVMAQEEPDPGLKTFLLDTEKRYESLYDRTTALLDNEYFKDPHGESSN